VWPTREVQAREVLESSLPGGQHPAGQRQQLVLFIFMRKKLEASQVFQRREQLQVLWVQ